MGKKEKKKKLPLGRTLSNNIFALRQVWEGSRSYFFMYYFVTVLNAPLNFLLTTYLVRAIVDSVSGTGWSTAEVFRYIFIVGGAGIVIWTLSNFYWNVPSVKARRNIQHRLKKKLYKKATEVELACYEDPAFYDKYVKAMDEVTIRVYNVMNTLDNLIWTFTSLSLNSLLLFTIDPLLIIFAVLPLVMGFVRHWGQVIYHGWQMAGKPSDRKYNYVRRTFYLSDYAKEMRLGRFSEQQLSMLADVRDEKTKLCGKHGTKFALSSVLYEYGMQTVTVLGAMAYSLWRTLGEGQGSMTPGDCIVVLTSIGNVSYMLSRVVQNFAEFSEHSLYIENVRYFLDYQPTITEDESAPEAKAGDVEIKNLHFKYKNAEKESLAGVNITIRKGEKIALVGRNGSGKTTLVKLLLRLYDPDEGEVLLDGKSAKEYRLSSWRGLFGCVFQDFKLFAMTVKDNVLLRREEQGDDERVDAALKASGAYEKVATLKNGVDSVLTREFDDEGVNLSIGEQQKISLARVFAAGAPFVVLDEPSSALDPIAEHKMFENMLKATEGKSVIFISHRLSSAVLADRVYMMEDGVVIEEGTHASLMAKGGKYAEMFRLQAENYKEGEKDE